MAFTHSAAVESSLRSRMIDGTATFTIVASTMIIETPRLSIASPSQRPRPSDCIDAVSAAWLVIPCRSCAPGSRSCSGARAGAGQLIDRMP